MKLTKTKKPKFDFSKPSGIDRQVFTALYQFAEKHAAMDTVLSAGTYANDLTEEAWNMVEKYKESPFKELFVDCALILAGVPKRTLAVDYGEGEGWDDDETGEHNINVELAKELKEMDKK